MDRWDTFCLLDATVAGAYRVVAVAGANGLGVVYRGFELGSRRPIAMQCLNVPASLDAPARAQLVRALTRETLVTHRLGGIGRALVPVLDVGMARTPCAGFFPYVVRDWLDGETFELFVARERPSSGALAWTLALLQPVADALARAHELRLAHCGVRPDSLFLARSGGRHALVLLDLGVFGALLQAPALLAASPRQRHGLRDPRYGAPELVDSRYGPLGPHSDVFSFALLVSELVSGRPALAGRNALEWSIAAANPLRRPTPRTLGAVVPDHVERALERALAPEPGARFPTLRSFWNALTGQR